MVVEPSSIRENDLLSSTPWNARADRVAAVEKLNACIRLWPNPKYGAHASHHATRARGFYSPALNTFAIHVQIVFPAFTLTLTPVRALPILRPTLFDATLSDLNSDTPAAVGVVSMDGVRKLQFLPSSALLSGPLIGIWMRGLATLSHPDLMTSALWFLKSNQIQQRTLVQPDTFLLCVVNGSAVDFFEVLLTHDSPFEQVADNQHLLGLVPGPPSGDASSDEECMLHIARRSKLPESLLVQLTSVNHDLPLLGTSGQSLRTNGSLVPPVLEPSPDVSQYVSRQLGSSSSTSPFASETFSPVSDPVRFADLVLSFSSSLSFCLPLFCPCFFLAFYLSLSLSESFPVFFKSSHK